ncbi:MAG: DUF4272 domain-containing protein [Phycisphaerae bacterium]|nr:DUF4272 domain-containing protein [Phycisphaerae bacterium]
MDPSEKPTVDESQLQGVVRTNMDSPEPTAAQLARKARSIEQVKAMGLPFIEHLPVVEDQTQIEPRTPQEVASRCLAVAICALKGETQGQEAEFVDGLVKEYGAEGYFSPQEAVFIKDPAASEQELVNFCWRYECVHVFMWALGRVDGMASPGAICDVAHDIGAIRDAGPEAFISQAELRSQADILDMADLYYRLNWAAVEMRVKGAESDAIEEGIVCERHRSLNWLIRYMGQDWDDVTMDT